MKLNHPSIQCAADAVQAEEYDIWIETRFYRVTAYNAKDAKEAAEQYDKDRLKLAAEAHDAAQQELLP